MRFSYYFVGIDGLHLTDKIASLFFTACTHRILDLILSELAILHVVQPPPTAEDHNEVHAKLAEGRFD